MPKRFFRQQLLLLKPSGEWFPEQSEDREVCREWLESGRPVIVRRPVQSLDRKWVFCGLPLPSKRRIALMAKRSAVLAILPLPELNDCWELVPSELRPKLEPLRRLRPRVFGSLAWEYLTGVAYVTPESDVDLIFQLEASDRDKIFSVLRQSGVAGERRIDIEIQSGGIASSWREMADADKYLCKTDFGVFLRDPAKPWPDFRRIARLAAAALTGELETYPKPGLVSPVDCGSHPDMTVRHFRRSIRVLYFYFWRAALAGAMKMPFAELRRLGLEAEEWMLEVTGGRNTHRGAIFTLGLLCAAAGIKLVDRDRRSLGELVAERWGPYFSQPRPFSHGLKAELELGCGGARGEAASGFASVYQYGLPTLRQAGKLAAFFALLAHNDDSTLAHRGGPGAIEYGREVGKNFTGPAYAEAMHREFVRRNLTAGGVADLLAATIFIDRMEELWADW